MDSNRTQALTHTPTCSCASLSSLDTRSLWTPVDKGQRTNGPFCPSTGSTEGAQGTSFTSSKLDCRGPQTSRCQALITVLCSPITCRLVRTSLQPRSWLEPCFPRFLYLTAPHQADWLTRSLVRAMTASTCPPGPRLHDISHATWRYTHPVVSLGHLYLPQLSLSHELSPPHPQWKTQKPEFSTKKVFPKYKPPLRQGSWVPPSAVGTACL